MPFPFYLQILGSGSAIPRNNKNHTSQLLVYNNKYFLIDCGEGTQHQLQKFKINFQRIDQIFISHLHGDHYLGLAGLISTMNLLGRVKPLQIYGPPGIKEVIDLHFSIAKARSAFEIQFISTQDKEKKLICEVKDVNVYSFPLKHKIPTTGFLFEAGSNWRKMIPEKLEKYEVPKHLRAGIAAGKDYTRENGEVIPNEELTLPPPEKRRYAFCSDTAYFESLSEKIGCSLNLMYHEATFIEEDKKSAKEKYHTTAAQAAKQALNTGAEKLLIGHLSNKYPNEELSLKEAREVFKETYIAEEGEKYEI
jgi:ribonuclease Z